MTFPRKQRPRPFSRVRHARPQLLKQVIKSLLCATLAVGPGTATADFESGLRAFKEERYGVAFDEWESCANSGQADCQYAMGVLHDEGRAVEPDIYAALRWYERAARQAYPDAMMQLGFLYATGRGEIVQSAILAWMWFSRAAVHGVPQAIEHRDRIGSLLSIEELADAQRRADLLSFEYHQQAPAPAN